MQKIGNSFFFCHFIGMLYFFFFCTIIWSTQNILMVHTVYSQLCQLHWEQVNTMKHIKGSHRLSFMEHCYIRILHLESKSHSSSVSLWDLCHHWLHFSSLSSQYAQFSKWWLRNWFLKMIHLHMKPSSAFIGWTILMKVPYQVGLQFLNLKKNGTFDNPRLWR